MEAYTSAFKLSCDSLQKCLSVYDWTAVRALLIRHTTVESSTTGHLNTEGSFRLRATSHVGRRSNRTNYFVRRSSDFTRRRDDARRRLGLNQSMLDLSIVNTLRRTQSEWALRRANHVHATLQMAILTQYMTFTNITKRSTVTIYVYKNIAKLFRAG
jgi:hypothetical protein